MLQTLPALALSVPAAVPEPLLFDLLLAEATKISGIVPGEAGV